MRWNMLRAFLLVAGVILSSGSALASVLVAETNLTIDAARDRQPAVSGGTVVFTSDRFGTEDVLTFNAAGEIRFVGSGPGNQFAPDIDGDSVVFVDDFVGNENIGFASISAGAGTTLTVDAASDFSPAISGGLVVFVSDRFGNFDILSVDVTTRIVRSISATSAVEVAPDIDGDLIAWQSSSGSDFDIVATRVDGTPFLVAAGLENETEPSVSGDRVAYLVDGNVAVFDTITGLTTRVTNDAFVQSDVAIDGDFVVWTDIRTGNRDVFLHDLLDRQTYQITRDLAAQLEPHIDGAIIVFGDARDGNENIYQAFVDVNHAPVANAGADQSVLFGDVAQLNGTATDIDGDPITSWLWTMESAPIDSTATLFDPSVPNASFLPDLAGQYILSLVAGDGRDLSAADSVTIEVAPSAPVPLLGPLGLGLLTAVLLGASLRARLRARGLGNAKS